MTLSRAELEALAECARRAARSAGEVVARGRPSQRRIKPGHSSPASQIVTDIDHRAQRCILDILEPTSALFDLAILAEERADDGRRLESEYFWSIDPLDGTLPYLEGRAGFAVSIALVSRAGAPQIGVVFDAHAGVLFWAISGRGLVRDPPRDSLASGDVLTVFVDRSFDAKPHSARITLALEETAIARGLSGVELRVGAGAVMNACYALETPPSCYLKLPTSTPGGGSLWDFAATACLFAEAGASATDMRGRALDLNRADSTFMNHRGVLFATDRDFAEQIRQRCTA